MNTFEYFKDKISFNRKVAKVEQIFAKPIEEAKINQEEIVLADLEMHKEIEMQMMMKPAPDTLVYFYNEGVI